MTNNSKRGNFTKKIKKTKYVFKFKIKYKD